MKKRWRQNSKTWKWQSHQRSSAAKYTHVEPSSHATGRHGMCALIKLEGSSVDQRVWMSEVWITDIPEPLLNILNNVQVFYPWLRVQVSKFTETKSFLPSSTTTPGPITTFGPIRQPLPMVAEESWEDKTSATRWWTHGTWPLFGYLGNMSLMLTSNVYLNRHTSDVTLYIISDLARIYRPKGTNIISWPHLSSNTCCTCTTVNKAFSMFKSTKFRTRQFICSSRSSGC